MNTLKLIEIVAAADKDFALAQVPAETLEKFAELILQECLILFENAKVNQEDDVDYGLEEAKNIIKEHFGVEL